MENNVKTPECVYEDVLKTILRKIGKDAVCYKSPIPDSDREVDKMRSRIRINEATYISVSLTEKSQWIIDTNDLPLAAYVAKNLAAMGIDTYETFKRWAESQEF